MVCEEISRWAIARCEVQTGAALSSRASQGWAERWSRWKEEADMDAMLQGETPTMQLLFFRTEQMQRMETCGKNKRIKVVKIKKHVSRLTPGFVMFKKKKQTGWQIKWQDGHQSQISGR